MQLAGKPVIWHVFHRLGRCRSIDEIVLATSNDASDDPLAAYAEEQGVRVVRGPLDNVLQRYVTAAEESNADVIVRVTGDAPLVDPATIDQLVDALVAQDADYAALDPGSQTIHNGFEPFSARALARVVEVAGDDPANIEHVTPMMKRRPDMFRIVYVPSETDVRIQGVRTSVDTPADLEFLEEVYRRLGSAPGEINVRDIVALLRSEPELLALNAHVRQKTAFEPTRTVLFVCDGGATAGLGHVRRCLSLAHEVSERHSLGVRFALTGDATAAAVIREAGFGVEVREEHDGTEAWLAGQVESQHPDVIVFDTREPISAAAVARLGETGIRTATVDDASDRRLVADLVFMPPVPQVRRLNWDAGRGEVHIGWEWVVLGPEFASTSHEPTDERDIDVLVTMGGSDPGGLTGPIVDALARAIADSRVAAVIGPAFTESELLAQRLESLKSGISVLSNVSDMAGVMRRARIGVCRFGVSAYELAACGVVGMHICESADDAESSSTFVNEGIALSVGPEGDFGVDAVAQLVASLASDPDRVAEMSRRANKLIDGRGAARIAERLVALVR